MKSGGWLGSTTLSITSNRRVAETLVDGKLPQLTALRGALEAELPDHDALVAALATAAYRQAVFAIPISFDLRPRLRGLELANRNHADGHVAVRQSRAAETPDVATHDRPSPVNINGHSAVWTDGAASARMAEWVAEF